MKSRVVLLLLAGTLAGCRDPQAGTDAASGGDDGASDAPSTIDAPIMHVDDGTPTRQTCTNNFGAALTQSFGRLDGFLVAIVQPGAHGCNGDTDHIHLQIKANGAIYDIAVTASSPSVEDVHTATREMTLPAWSEGWHTGPAVVDDYVARGIHSTDLPLESKAQIATDVTADLATVNHISIFATGYGPDGAHLVHRNGHGNDGLIVTEPLSTPSHARVFSFSSLTF